MKKLIFTVGIIFTLASVGTAQTADSSANGDSLMNAAVNNTIQIEGQLQKSLDVKKARIGDEVVVKTTRAVKENGKTIIPKGSKLLGRITQITQRTKENNFSRLGLIFDRIEGKGVSSDLSAAIVSITSITGPAPLDSSFDLSGSSNTSARSSSRSSGGGLLGGTTSAAGGVLGGVTNTVGGTVNTGIQTVNGVTATAGNTVNSATSGILTNVNGLSVGSSANGSVQSGTTLSAQGKDLKVEIGATVRLQVTGDVKGQ